MTRTLFLLLLTLAPAAAQQPADLAKAVLDRYPQFSIAERQAAIAGLAARAGTAALLIDAMAAGTVARAEVSSLVAQQIAVLEKGALKERLEKAWGRIGSTAPGAEEAAKEHARLKALLTPEVVRQGRPREGRVLFKSVCANCHTLFDEGGATGPNLTGSNRADIDYLLENITNPSAVLGRDYELHVFTLRDGQAVAGMVRAETAAAYTVQTLTAEVTVAKDSVQQHDTPGISMMPPGLLTALTTEQARDLIAYLASPAQVPMPGEKDGGHGHVPGAIEGETMQVLKKTGSAGGQDMKGFPDGRWSGGHQLWWTGAQPGDRLTLALPVAAAGDYRIEAVLTRAPDYGVVKFFLDGEPLGEKQTDLFGSRVTVTPALVLGERKLTAGEHRLTIEITGANPEAAKSYMFGLDYVTLTRR